MKKIKTNKYESDLESLLEGKSIEQLIKEWEEKWNELLSLYKDFYKTFTNFKKWIKTSHELEIITNRLTNYVSNKLNQNLIDPKFLGLQQQLSIKANIFSQRISDYDNIIIANKVVIKKYLKDKKLCEYTRVFDHIFRYEPHILKPEHEQILSKLSIYSSGIEHVYNTLTNIDIKYGDAKDKNNKPVKLVTRSDIGKYLKSHDRILRKNVWINYVSAYEKFGNTLTQTLYYTYLKFNTLAKLRNFPDYISATLFSDEVDIPFLLKLYDNVAQFKSVNKKYVDILKYLLKQKFHLNKVEPWDMSLDISTKPINVTIPQAQKIILEALKPLGEEYLNVIKKAFTERWISWLPRLNKQSGAYSIGGITGLKKYFIHMNFEGTMDSVETLAHELGHSVHSYYSVKNQKIYADYEIFYAEIASNTTETLLYFYLINKYKKNKELVNTYLKRILDNFFNCTTRQIQFSNFEYEANRMVNESIPFDFASLKKLNLETIQKYQIISKNKLAQYKKQPYTKSLATILGIDHFYIGNFYVYKYAIGQICGLIMAYHIFKGSRIHLNKFIDFLSSGSAKSPLNTIKILGIDLTKIEPYNEAIKIIKKLLAAFKY